MRVFLTGATGFLGAEIARELGLRGHDCIAMARRIAGAGRLSAMAPGARIVAGDLFDPESCRALMSHWRPEALIHCGWRGVLGAERNDVAQLDNIAASARLAEAALAHGARIIIGAGSQAEYGARPYAVAESDPPSPETLYGVAKVAAANAFETLARLHGARAAWGRVFSLYGPGQEPPWLVASLICAFARGEAPALTACEQMWEFTHVRDAAQAVVAILDSNEARGVFNIASGETIRLRDAVSMLRDLVAPGVEPLFGKIPYRPDQVMHLEARIDRIRALAGWTPRIGLAEGFAETVAAFARAREAA
jgi:nucleoside-diphosphate-sugar epimerase